MPTLVPLDRPSKNLFWSAPVEDDSDFTPEDPLAFDYLGQQVGLWLFQNLTTRTARAQNYAVVLYGLDLAQRACLVYNHQPDDEMLQRLFERWERFWALSVLEFREGQLERGDTDAMRGVLGVKRVWRAGEQTLPLDFKLISRQSELGSLGAYLSSLREYGLVTKGSLRPAPIARDIVDSFWEESDSGARVGVFDDYAMQALDLTKSTVGRRNKTGSVKLRTIGERSRLSSLVDRKREKQQGRLWMALFENARDGTTLPLAHLVQSATRVDVLAPRDVIESALGGAWGGVSFELRERMELALAFGDAVVELLDRFNAVYRAAIEAGFVAPADRIAAEAFDDESVARVRAVCAAVLSKPFAAKFRSLAVHGRTFLNMLSTLEHAPASDYLNILLSNHRSVQVERRRGNGWMRQDPGKIVIDLTSYKGYSTDAMFPSLKINVVRQLLRDLGKL